MVKLKIYLKSGSEIIVHCEEYRFTYSNETLEYNGYKFKGLKKQVSIVPSQIAAFEEL